MKDKQEWYIGIDFGTSNTYVIAYEKQMGVFTSLSLVEDGVDNFGNIPTEISVEAVVGKSKQINPDNFKYYFGMFTEQHPTLRKFNKLKTAARELTPPNGTFGGTEKPCEYPFEHCELKTKLQFGSNDYDVSVTVRELLVQFFKNLFYSVNKEPDIKINKDTVKKFVVGMPVETSNGSTEEKYAATLKGIISEAFTGDANNAKFIGTKSKPGIVECVSEPELAGITYLYSKNIRNKKVLVIDIGGGTTDFSVLKYVDNGETEAENIGRCDIAGDEIDKLILDLLPDDMPHSKKCCKTAKENLFSRANVLAIGDLGKYNDAPFNLYYNKSDILSNMHGIVLTKGKSYVGGRDCKTLRETIIDLFNKISEKLKAALNSWKPKDKIKHIDKIFFVGGTSIITPLREKLVEAVEEGLNCSFTEGSIVTTFSGQPITLQADGMESLTVNTYNAVAIGAFIKAMGKENLDVKPKLTCKLYGRDNSTVFETSDNNLIIKTDKEKHYAALGIDESKVKSLCNSYGFLGVTLTINNEVKNLRVPAEKFAMVTEGITIIAYMKRNETVFKIFNYFTYDSKTATYENIESHQLLYCSEQ